jgi:hypothetical protein
MRFFLFATLLLLTLAAYSQKLAFGPFMGYGSPQGQIRLLAYRLTGGWSDLAASREVIYQILPASYTKEAEYMSREGFVRLVGYRYLGNWYADDESLVVVGRIFAHAQGKL